MSQLAIQVEDLTKTYGPVVAVDHINFAVAPGELIGFLGPNGAGKSTTMRILTTFQPATSGVARVNGFDVMTQSMDVRKCIGYLPESVPLYLEMRVEEYLLYRAKLKGIDRHQRPKRIDYVLERCRIKEVSRRLTGTLSRGYRQRVGLADALLQDPPVLILDEPTAGLDPVQIRETLNTIRDLAGTHTVLLSTHILPEVEGICDRVIIINRGKIRWDGKLSELAQQAPVMLFEVRGPLHAVRDWLLGQPGVTGVTAKPLEGEFGLFEVESANGADLREKLAECLHAKGWGLRRLALRRQKLDDLYMEVVLRQRAAQAAVA